MPEDELKDLQAQLRGADMLMNDMRAVNASLTAARDALYARATAAEAMVLKVQTGASEQASRLSLLILAVEAVLNKADMEGIREWRCIRALRKAWEEAK